MFYETQRITIIKIDKPKKNDLNTELMWFGDSLGLFGLRDKDKSCFRIFVELIKSTKENKPISSDELAFKLHLSRGTVVHHLNKLTDAGFIISRKNRYVLRVDNLEHLIDELKDDVKKTLDNLKEIASQIDKSLGL